MRAEFKSDNYTDPNGKPAGGFVEGKGLRINWQNGPTAYKNKPCFCGEFEQNHNDDKCPLRYKTMVDGERMEPNGAFVETVIAAAQQRISYYQNTGFECIENDRAIKYLQMALDELNARTERRVNAGVEGTHEGK